MKQEDFSLMNPNIDFDLFHNIFWEEIKIKLLVC